MAPNPDRLRETLGRPELSRLWQRLRQRLEKGHPLVGATTFENLSEAEQDAFSRLLGRPPARGRRMTVDLDSLERRLAAAGLCESLAEAVAHLTGPVSNQAEVRRRDAAEWQRLFDEARTGLSSRPELTVWLDRLWSQGVLRRHGIDQARILLSQALRVAARLPADDVLLARLAAETVGDAHALDLGRPLGGLILRLADPLGGVSSWENAATRREAWASMGVVLDDLSAPVLVLNLRSSGSGPVARVLNTWAEAGEPGHLTLRSLRRTPPGFSTDVTGPRVFVCENPNIVATVAERLGNSSAPLLCTEGQPRTAVHVLLTQLTTAGIRINYHSDFDWPGIQMANALLAKHDAQPWRMSAADYREAAILDFPLSGAPIAVAWDPDLRDAMASIGRTVHEEQVVDRLLDDLRVPPALFSCP